MPANRLAQLDRHTVAVELSQNGQRKTLRGKAAYGRDPQMGGVLTINIQESWGDFDFVLNEAEFDGDIALAADGREYQIRLAAECVCTS